MIKDVLCCELLLVCQHLRVRTFLKVYMELGSYFLFLQEQIKDIIIIQENAFQQAQENACQHTKIAYVCVYFPRTEHVKEKSHVNMRPLFLMYWLHLRPLPPGLHNAVPAGRQGA